MADGRTKVLNGCLMPLSQQVVFCTQHNFTPPLGVTAATVLPLMPATRLGHLTSDGQVEGSVLGGDSNLLAALQKPRSSPGGYSPAFMLISVVVKRLLKTIA